VSSEHLGVVPYSHGVIQRGRYKPWFFIGVDSVELVLLLAIYAYNRALVPLDVQASLPTPDNKHLDERLRTDNNNLLIFD
jgi:hypothetical protein